MRSTRIYKSCRFYFIW